MPGYLRPHVKITLPGPKDPKYKPDQDEAGRDGSYWVEFTLRPNALLKTDLEEQELFSGFIGDSHLIVSDPLPEDVDRKNIFDIEVPHEKLKFFVYCNSQGRLSHVNFLCNAKNFKDAIDRAKRYFEPFLSGWSFRFNIPFYILRIRAKEESTGIVHCLLYHQLYPEVRVTLEEILRVYWLPHDFRVFDFYREALNSTSSKYRDIVESRCDAVA